ncbi:unnamed protein product, partial [marine sediment metagenome]
LAEHNNQKPPKVKMFTPLEAKLSNGVYPVLDLTF